MLRLVGAVCAGYLSGNVPTADLVARLAGNDFPDLRSVGSQNPGGLNAAKELGVGWGALVSVVDVGKGVVASALGRTLAGAHGANLGAAASVLGHCHPVGRSGGKGVATSIGQGIGTFPPYLPIDVGVAAATASVPAWKQRTRVATTAASAVWVNRATPARARRWAAGIDSPAAVTLPLAAAIPSSIIARRFADPPLTDGKPK